MSYKYFVPAIGPHRAELRLPSGDTVSVTGFTTATTATRVGWAFARALREHLGAARVTMTIRPEQEPAP